MQPPRALLGLAALELGGKVVLVLELGEKVVLVLEGQVEQMVKEAPPFSFW